MPEKVSMLNYLGVSSIDELESFVRENIDGIKGPELAKAMEYAHRFVADNAIYQLAKSSRLPYIQRRLKEEGINDFEDVDSHIIAAMLQTFYRVNMNFAPSFALMQLHAPFVTEVNVRE